MDDRRRSPRMELAGEIILKRLDSKVHKESEIDIIDLSRSGVGFYCKDPLVRGSIYECNLTIWTKEVLHCFLEIVRIKREKNRIFYGAIFIGMTELDASRIDVYRTVQENSEE